MMTKEQRAVAELMSRATGKKAVPISLCAILTAILNDRDRVDEWMRTVNPLLGNLAPNDVIAGGGEGRIMRILLESLEWNAEE